MMKRKWRIIQLEYVFIMIFVNSTSFNTNQDLPSQTFPIFSYPVAHSQPQVDDELSHWQRSPPLQASRPHMPGIYMNIQVAAVNILAKTLISPPLSNLDISNS